MDRSTDLLARIRAAIVAGSLSRHASSQELGAQFPAESTESLRLASAYLLGYVDGSDGVENSELVWTGPDVGLPMRSTGQVVRELIEHAQRYVVQAGYRIGAIHDRGDSALGYLASAARRAVRITIVVDDAAENEAALRTAAWPTTNRPRLLTWRAANRGLLHTKVTVVDDEGALLTSANPTYHGSSRNLELGVLLRGAAALRIRQHFDDLERTGVLERLSYEWSR